MRMSATGKCASAIIAEYLVGMIGEHLVVLSGGEAERSLIAGCRVAGGCTTLFCSAVSSITAFQSKYMLRSYCGDTHEFPRVA